MEPEQTDAGSEADPVFTTMAAPEDVSVAAVAKEHHKGFSSTVY